MSTLDNLKALFDLDPTLCLREDCPMAIVYQGKLKFKGIPELVMGLCQEHHDELPNEIPGFIYKRIIITKVTNVENQSSVATLEHEKN